MIENEIYEILDNEDYYYATDVYYGEAVAAVLTYLSSLSVPWHSINHEHPDQESGSVSVAWIENNRLYHTLIDYHN